MDLALRQLADHAPKIVAGSRGLTRDAVALDQYLAALWLRGWPAPLLAETVGIDRRRAHWRAQRYLRMFGDPVNLPAGLPVPDPPPYVKIDSPARAARVLPKGTAWVTPPLPESIAVELRRLRAAVIRPSGHTTRKGPDAIAYRELLAALFVAGWSERSLCEGAGMKYRANARVDHLIRAHINRVGLERVEQLAATLPKPPGTGLRPSKMRTNTQVSALLRAGRDGSGSDR